MGGGKEGPFAKREKKKSKEKKGKQALYFRRGREGEGGKFVLA